MVGPHPIENAGDTAAIDLVSSRTCTECLRGTVPVFNDADVKWFPRNAAGGRNAPLLCACECVRPPSQGDPDPRSFSRGPGLPGKARQRVGFLPRRREPGSGSFAAQDSATEHRDRSDGPSSWVRNETFDNFGPLANAMEADYQRTERTAESARRVASVSPSLMWRIMCKASFLRMRSLFLN